MKIHTWDLVEIIAGKDKNKQGTVTSVLLERERVVVAGINKAKKHVKPANGQPGQIIEKEMSLHVSNVAIIDPDTKKPTRVGFKMEGKKKIRIAKKSGKTLAK